MFIIVHGMVEMSMVYDRSKTIVERLGIGTVINPFNFIAEELMLLQAQVATHQATIYQIDKRTFFEIAKNDKRLLKGVLKLLVEDFDYEGDVLIKYLDFCNPNKRLQWRIAVSEEDLPRAQYLSNKVKEAFL